MTLTEAQIAHVKSLEDARGGITPDSIVENAKQKSSPLHELFDWDKAKAARAWWLVCAREIIREVHIVVTTTSTTYRAPYYVRDPDAKGQGYRSVAVLQADPTAARQALIDELTRAAGVVTRARQVAVVLHLEDEVDAMLERIVGLQRRVQEAA